MPTKIISKDVLLENESLDKRLVAVSVRATSAGSDYANIAYFIWQPFLRGEDYPALVNVWDNKDDDIFDEL